MSARRFKRYPAYKDSGVEWLGEIPAGWEVKGLKRVFRVVNGSTPASAEPAFWDGDIPWVTPEDLGDLRGAVIHETRRSITRDGYQSCGTTLVPAGSLVLSTRAPIGHLALAGVDLCTNQGCRSLVFRRDQSREYFFYALVAARPELESLGQGSTFRELAKGMLEDVGLAEPPEPEQRAIAAFLDRETARIDALVAKKERLIALLQEQRTALITRVVTKGLDPTVPMKDSGVEWLGEIPAHWRALALKRIGDLQAGAGFPDDEQGIQDEETPFFKVGDMGAPGNEREMLVHQHSVSRSTARRLRAHVFPAGTIVFAKVGAALLLNRRRLIARPSCLDNNMMGFMPDDCDTTWALYWLTGLDMGRLANPGAVPSVNEGQMRETPAAVPPLPEQRAIAAFLDRETARIDTLVAKVHDAIDRLKELRTALISAAVTGKIDVREEVA
jgi:type I restriction enzyme S subunit